MPLIHFKNKRLDADVEEGLSVLDAALRHRFQPGGGAADRLHARGRRELWGIFGIGRERTLPVVG